MIDDSHSRAPPGRGRAPRFRGEPAIPRAAAPSYRTFTRFPEREMS